MILNFPANKPGACATYLNPAVSASRPIKEKVLACLHMPVAFERTSLLL